MSEPGTTQHHFLDFGALTLTIGAFAGVLPYIAAALAILWYCVLLYDRFINKRRAGE